MKKAILVVLALGMIGCTATNKNYFDNPEYLVQDPHFASYQEQRDELEHRYLSKEISFAQYQEEKKELDDKYAQEVKSREENLYEE